MQQKNSDQVSTSMNSLPSSAPPKILLQGVAKQFDVRGKFIDALQPTNLEVRSHEFVALVGPSGCGKSTILNMVAGLMQPSAGQVWYDSKPVSGPNSAIGYMTQKDTLLPWRTTRRNVGIALELKCRASERAEAPQRIDQIIEAVGLKGFEDHYPAELSGGMRKRAALARTLLYQPETLLMDEPFGALDAQLKLVMLEQLQKLTSERRMTVLFVTHDLGEAITLADRVVVFGARPGRIRTIRDITLPRPRDVYKIRFTPEFARLHEELWEELKDEVLLGSDL